MSSSTCSTTGAPPPSARLCGIAGRQLWRGSGPAVTALSGSSAVAVMCWPHLQRHPEAPAGHARPGGQTSLRRRLSHACSGGCRGVRFGLDGGRVESIMVSAPPLVVWRYAAAPAPGSPEAALVEVLRAPRAWA